MKHFIFIRALSQHKAVLCEESGVKIVQIDKEPISQYSDVLNSYPTRTIVLRFETTKPCASGKS